MPELFFELPVQSNLRLRQRIRHRIPELLEPLDRHRDEEGVHGLATLAQVAKTLLDDFVPWES